jgi:hypothetical protein
MVSSFINCSSNESGSWKCSVEIISKAPIDLELYYRSNINQKFQENKKIRGIKVKQANQINYEFVLPDTVSLIDFRLDFANDSICESVKLSKIIVAKSKRSIEIYADEIPGFFNINQFGKFGLSPGSIEFNTVNGRFDPFLKAKPVLIYLLSQAKIGLWIKQNDEKNYQK